MEGAVPGLAEKYYWLKKVFLMVEFFLHVFDFLKKRRGLCLTLAAVLTAILIAMVSSLKYNENIYDFLPLSGNEQRAITVYQDVTGGQRIYAMFKAKEESGEQSDKQEEAVDTFAAKIMAGDGKRHVSEITTQVDFDKIANITAFLYQNVPFMLSDSDYVRMENMLRAPDFADSQLAADVQMMMMPATGFFTPRGGISIHPYANYGRPGTKFEALAQQRFAAHE